MRMTTRTIGVAVLFSLAAGCQGKTKDEDCIKNRTCPECPPHRPPDIDTPEKLNALLGKLERPKKRELKRELVSKLVKLSIKCAEKEYPNKPSDVQASDKSVMPPRKLHPAFFGCFDWHSAVHGHWAMVRAIKLFPKIPEAGAIRRILNRHLHPKRMAGEAAYFSEKHHKLFERPYGWGWFLRLAAEVHTFKDPEARKWAEAIGPLEELLVKRTIDYLKRLSTPVRAGTHASTAFALAHIHDYARTRGRKSLQKAIDQAARRYYLKDRKCPANYEPSGEDFISPCMAEADLMRRVLPKTRFREWLTGFLPALSSKNFESLRTPPTVLDPKDPKIGHLIGLSLHRSWTMKAVGGALNPNDGRARVLKRLSEIHRNHAFGLLFESGYGGAHWLASFAVMTYGGELR